MVVKAGEVKIDAETLKGQDSLSDDQAAAIAVEALNEIGADEQKKKKLDEEESGEQGKDKAEDALKEETEPTAEELAAKEKEEQVKEEKRILEAKDEDLSEEEKTKKAEIVKTQEESKTKASQQEVSDYAKEHNVSEEEAREDLESIAKIQEKYKGDPKQLAKANLHLQRIYSKTEAEAKALKDAKPKATEIKDIPIEAVEKWISEGKVTYKDKPVTKEGVITAYREANPDLTDSMEDEKVFKLAVKDYKAALEKGLEQDRAKVSIAAKEKRDTIFNTVSEADKKYIPELKPLIEKLSDAQIMDEHFNLETYITYAKGKAFDTTTKQLEEDKKAFGEKEYKRGLEEAKILGTKRPPIGNGPANKSNAPLTDEQKQRAREMFDNPDITEDQAYKLYSDYLKERKVS
jgi:hypothetical protein